MATKTPAPQVETYAQTLLRLLEKARREGCRMKAHTTDTYGYVSSGTVEGVWYRVDHDGCTCPAFPKFGYCKHFAAWLAHSGDLEPEPSPSGPAAEARQLSEALDYGDPWDEPVSLHERFPGIIHHYPKAA